jgi:membrane peptidoglycan carboxypeptidase
MSESARFRLSALVKLVAMVVVAGVLVAAMLLPFVGGTGLIARNSSTLLDALPVELTDKTPNGNTEVLAADGSLITEFYSNNRTPVTPDQISAVMKQAIVDIEDSRFYEHNGLDVQGTMRALAKNLAAGGVEEGGSTLTQQLVKQTLLQTADTPEEAAAATEQTVGRKLKEARLALALERTYSKDEILTRYLNIAYFGHGAYGIQAAAQTYFSMNAVDLTLPQASVLAGLVQSPSDDDPLLHPDAATNRRNQVLNRMHQLGHISDQELADASAAPVQTAEGAKPPNGCSGATIGGYFCDYLQTYLTQTLGLGKSELENGGYTIQTTLRPDLQQSADQGVLNYAPMGDRFAGIFTAVQPGTGHVLAMSVNRQYGCPASQGPQCEAVNLNTVASAGAGSTYKVFTAAAALTAGFGAHYTITAPQPYYSKVYKQNGGTKGAPYRVPNDNLNYKATYDMAGALTASSNTYFVALEDALGSVDGPVNISKAMGMHYTQPLQLATCPAGCTDRGQYYIDAKQGSFTLGPDATSPLDLASAYGTLAAQGTQCDPTPVSAILTSAGQPATKGDGTPLYAGDKCTPNAVAPGVANTLSNMLLNVVEDGTGRKAAIPGYQIAGKTGTINNDFSATFVGITPNYAVSVMYFNNKEQEDVGGHGGGVPAQIYHDAMLPILTKEPAAVFPPSDPAVEAGTKGPGPGAAAPAPTRTQTNNGGRATTPGTTTPAPPADTTPAPPADPAAPPADPAAPTPPG